MIDDELALSMVKRLMINLRLTQPRMLTPTLSLVVCELLALYATLLSLEPPTFSRIQSTVRRRDTYEVLGLVVLGPKRPIMYI
jgi:hypothetical protein